jgi:hypothetical protein
MWFLSMQGTSPALKDNLSTRVLIPKRDIQGHLAIVYMKPEAVVQAVTIGGGKGVIVIESVEFCVQDSAERIDHLSSQLCHGGCETHRPKHHA